MRTIKFRGKKKSGEWLYGDLMHYCGATLILPLDANWYDFVPKKDNPFRLPSSKFEVDPDTVGQFTGLHDKNGKEIYEGDIVSHPWKDPIFGDLVETGQFVHSTICFNNGAFVVNYRLQGEYIYLQDFVRLKCLEVVGNIHDNPELIKKGGDNA